ncbi:unnamed protein product [Paramecium sonneborni]|uniref:WD40-repeat-containing domain n=1 Tax=Paramecium sonneborni TaxID=65129 RepID=A0A8S1KTN2_9CILI|nr:unnamed protein product [Paramecium sonneborni]
MNSQFLVGCGINKIIYCWNFKARKGIAKFQGHSEQVNIAKISQDNLTVASGSHDKLIRFWNLQENFNRMAQDGHEDQVNHLEFSVDGLILYSSSQDKTLKLWNMQQKILFLSKDFEFGIDSFSFSENQKSIIITQLERVEFWHIQQYQVMQKSSTELINGFRSQNSSIKANIKQIQFLSNKSEFITLSDYNYENKGKKEQFSIAEIQDIQKLEEQISPKIYQYAEIQIELYQVSRNGQYICFLDSDNQLNLGDNFQIKEKKKPLKVTYIQKLRFFYKFLFFQLFIIQLKLKAYKNCFIAVFLPNKKIIVSNKDYQIEFRDCENIDSLGLNSVMLYKQSIIRRKLKIQQYLERKNYYHKFVKKVFSNFGIQQIYTKQNQQGLFILNKIQINLDLQMISIDIAQYIPQKKIQCISWNIKIQKSLMLNKYLFPFIIFFIFQLCLNQELSHYVEKLQLFGIMIQMKKNS